jgi:hypothetical protein
MALTVAAVLLTWAFDKLARQRIRAGTASMHAITT